MVLDSLARASRYAHLSAILSRALRHLTLTDWNAHPFGRHLLEGGDIVAIVSEYDTQRAEAVPWEAHRRYIDVQYVHSGIERIGFAPLSTLKVGAYDDERDLVRATGEGGYITLPAGSFAILWPDEAHRPGIALDESVRVKKIVLKVQRWC
jgi:biofilm protein TabA